MSRKRAASADRFGEARRHVSRDTRTQPSEQMTFPGWFDAPSREPAEPAASLRRSVNGEASSVITGTDDRIADSPAPPRIARRGMPAGLSRAQVFVKASKQGGPS